VSENVRSTTRPRQRIRTAHYTTQSRTVELSVLPVARIYRQRQGPKAAQKELRIFQDLKNADKRLLTS
jgi:hypothetical protein